MSNRGQCSGYPPLDPVPVKKEQAEAPLDWKPIEGERSRTYYYGDGNNITIENVIKLCVRPSGNHRIETSSGKKVIMAADWLCLELDTDKWVW